MPSILSAYRKAQNRLLLLDYDGTLVNFAPTPPQADPPPALLSLLDKLAADPRNQVVIISGRDQLVMDQWLGQLDVNMSAEHGLFIKPRDRPWQATVPLTDSWRPIVTQLLQVATSQLPGSFIELKLGSLTWHYRQADPKLAQHLAAQLTSQLATQASRYRLVILQAHKALEIKPGNYDKSAAVNYWLRQQSFDFILAAGDDTTDEDIFTALPASAHTFKIGPDPTSAQNRLSNPQALLQLLSNLL